MSFPGKCLTPAEFKNRCSTANIMITQASLKLNEWLATITLAYSEAWSAHVKVLEKAEATARLINDMVLGAALAFVPGGVGGLIGDNMKKLSQGVFMIDAAKDLGKFGLRSGAVVGLPASSYSTSTSLKAFPTSPLSWSSMVSARINAELGVVAAALLAWKEAVDRNDSKFETNFDPADVVKDVLRLTMGKGAVGGGASTKAIGDLAPENPLILQQRFEQGFWVGWVDNFAFRTYAGLSQVAWGGFIGDGVKDILVKYAVGIGLCDAKRLLEEAVSKGVQENNQRAIRSGRGLI